MKINIMCIGDIVGRPGRWILAEKLHQVIQQYDIDCVIANAENAAGGSGITHQIYEKLLKYGVNVITLGDHAFRKKDIISTLESKDDIIRPANLSEYAAGRGIAFYKTGKGPTVAVISLIGRIFMKPADCPYKAVDKLISQARSNAEIIVIDFHAEATSEKIAMGYYTDGRVSCCYGTHTHVVTADETILPKGTAYITDIGMTASHDSVLGRSKENVIKSFRTQMPFPFDVAHDDVRINSILVTADSITGKAESIQRLRVDIESSDQTAYDNDDGKPEHGQTSFS